MKKILISVIVPDELHRVVKAVTAFLQGTTGTYHCLLLNTYMVPAASSREVIRMNDDLKQKSLVGLNQALEAAQAVSSNGQMSFELISQIGALTNVIPRLVEERGIDCVIIGKSGDSRQENIVTLLNRVTCPVLVVP